jgi:hypothetical protein
MKDPKDYPEYSTDIDESTIDRLSKEGMELRLEVQRRTSKMRGSHNESYDFKTTIKRLEVMVQHAEHLVAIIHGDNGQHQDNVGFIQACVDAEKRFQEVSLSRVLVECAKCGSPNCYECLCC